MEQINSFQAVILGLIQGLTEFLPISSSGHLILTRDVFKFPDPGKTFDILMHAGTLVALVIYFWEDLARIAAGVFADFRNKTFHGTENTNLFWFLVISTIPGGLLGLLFHDQLESINSVYLISAPLIIFAVILYLADKNGKKDRFFKDFTFKDALIVGLFQAVALFPGVSRSGITMTAALMLGFDRTGAARYSFLASVPLIGGISAYGIIKLLKSGIDGGAMTFYALGFIAAVVSGFLCIKYLLEYLKKGSFTPFVIYRAAIGLLLMGLKLSGRI